MKIYTKVGDKGQTSLFGGTKVKKNHYRIEAYGTVDELNAYIGLLRDVDDEVHRKNFLMSIQNLLFSIGSMLAAENEKAKSHVPKVEERDIEMLEKEMDRMDELLEPMRNFILPGGHQKVSFCHIARTICRRAERMVIQMDEKEKVDPLIIKFLNRLSDYLFVLARTITKELKLNETPWKGKYAL